ncbi:MAG: hypothetical protein ABSH46_19825 [Bryobacteraceae bacterium]|jgi:hypothetical protein
MSEEEQDAVIGRLVREHAEKKRRLLAMVSELERYREAFASLASGLAHNINPEFNLTVTQREISNAPLSQFDFTKLTSFLQELTDLRKSVEREAPKLRELGL